MFPLSSLTIILTQFFLNGIGATILKSETMDVNNAESYDNVKKSAQAAILHKRTATELKYYEDEYIQHFVDYQHHHPVLTIVYTLRVESARGAIKAFIDLFPNQKVQFVNLGSGFDTISFHVLKNFDNVVCYETDFEVQLKMKCEIMNSHQCFKDLIPDYKVYNGLVTSERYKMVPFDLTETEQFQNLIQAGLLKTLPTVFLAEAVFMYIDPDKSDQTIKFLSQFCDEPSCYISLEFLSHDDSFGENAAQRFKKFDIELLGVKKYKNSSDHDQRYKNLGWDHSKTNLLSSVWNYLSLEQRKKLRDIEKFFEVELLMLLSSHNMISINTKKLNDPNRILDLFKKNEQESNSLEDSDKLEPDLTITLNESKLKSMDDIFDAALKMLEKK